MFSDSLSEVGATTEVLESNQSMEPIYFTVEPETGDKNIDSKFTVDEDTIEIINTKNKQIEDNNNAIQGNETGQIRKEKITNDETGVNNNLEVKGDEKPERNTNNDESYENPECNTNNGGECDEKPERKTTLDDSDDEITADQDFSFIEDETSNVKKCRKSLQQFSVAVSKDRAVVNSKALPVLKENGFVDMMESFSGFNPVPTASSTPGKSVLKHSDTPTVRHSVPNTVNSDPDTQSHDAVTQSHDSVAQSPDAVPQSSDSVTKSPDTLPQSSDDICQPSADVMQTSANVPSDVVSNAVTHDLNGTNSNIHHKSKTEANASISNHSNAVNQIGNVSNTCNESDEVGNTNEKFEDMHSAPTKASDGESDEYLSSSGYELPIPPEHSVTAAYAVVDKSPVATLCGKDARVPDDQLYQEYQSKPLPHRPTSMTNTPEKTPIKKDSQRSDTSTESNLYTPLMPDNISDSLTSSIGMRAYDRTMSLNTSLVREPNESYYASLVANTNKEEESRRDSLLHPWYVVSVGVGHLDLRKRPKPSGGLDFFRSFSSTDPEPLLIIWKLV